MQLTAQNMQREAPSHFTYPLVFIEGQPISFPDAVRLTGAAVFGRQRQSFTGMRSDAPGQHMSELESRQQGIGALGHVEVCARGWCPHSQSQQAPHGKWDDQVLVGMTCQDGAALHEPAARPASLRPLDAEILGGLRCQQAWRSVRAQLEELARRVHRGQCATHFVHRE